MKHIIINEFTSITRIYEDNNLRDSFSYTDYSFLEKYDECDVCLISPELEILPQYEKVCVKGWYELFAQKYSDKVLTLWFIDKNMKFCPYRGGDDARQNFMHKVGNHICIGGNLDDATDNMSMDEFCKILIDLISTSEESQIENPNKELQIISETLNNLTDKVNFIYEQTRDSLAMTSMCNELKQELSTYRNDFYLKSVQRLGLDALIEILDSMCLRLYTTANLSNDTKESIRYDIKLVERALKNRFNIQCVYSEKGTLFDEETMVTFPSDFIETKDESLKKCVAYSVSPAIYWTIPRVNSEEQKFLYKEESVILYN